MGLRTASLSERLTIVIVTRNRPRLLSGVLRYYENNRPLPKILVGDSSDAEATAATARVIQAMTPQVPIEHIEYAPDLGIYAAATDLLSRVSTPYCALQADDDFLVSGTLQDAVDFLDREPGYSVAHGRAVLVTLPRSSADRMISAPYAQRNIDDDRAGDRLTRHLSGHSALAFSVHRTDNMRSNYQQAVSARFDTKYAELLTGCLAVIQGKLKRLDRLYMVRQAHAEQDSVKVSGKLDVFDWLTHAEWPRQWMEFSNRLTAELARVDHITEDEARAIVKNAFWSYLNTVLPLKHPHRREEPSRIRRAQRLLTKHPSSRAALIGARRLFPLRRDEMSLWALQSTESPYHADFSRVSRFFDLPADWPQSTA